MTLTPRKNSMFNNAAASVFSKTLFVLCVSALLILASAVVFAVDADGDGFDPTGGNTGDCDDTNAEVRPLTNLSVNIIGSDIRICPGMYINTTLVVNETSNTTNATEPLSIACNPGSNGSANFSFNAPNTNFSTWLLIENITAGASAVIVENCSVNGLGYNGSQSSPSNVTAATQSNDTMGINISNSSNIRIAAIKLTNLRWGGVYIDGGSNISILNSGFDNISGNTSLQATVDRDIITVRYGTNVTIENNNITAGGTAVDHGGAAAVGSGNNVSNMATTYKIGINVSAGRVIVRDNVIGNHGLTACFRTNSSDHYIINNSCSNNTVGFYLAGSKNVTFIDNNVSNVNSSEVTAYTAAVFLENNANFTGYNILVTIYPGIGIYMTNTNQSTFTNSTVDQTFRGMVLNVSDNNFFTGNIIRLINNSFFDAVNSSDNLTLNLNKYWNSSFNGLQFWNVTELRMTNQWVKNFTNVGLKLDASSGAIITNVSLNSTNHSAYDYMTNLSTNITLDGFNSTATFGTAVILINSSTINLSHYNIMNATFNGITIWNTSNVFSNAYVSGNYTMNNLNGTTYLFINVTNFSSNVNLSNIIIGNYGNGSRHVDGVMVNASDNISFHNISIRNMSRAAFIYGNTSSPSGGNVIGYCNVSLEANQDTFGLLVSGRNSSVSPFFCDKLVNVTMTDVLLSASTSTGSQVRFGDKINITGASPLDSYVNFSSADKLYVNMSGLNATAGNRAANVTLTGMGYEASGVLVDYDDDGVFQACGANCTLTSTGGVLSFNVSHFSTYQASPSVSSFSTGGGGGGSGGRGGGFKTVIPTSTGVTVQLTNYDAARIQIGTEAYSFTLVRAYRDAVDIKVALKEYKLALGRAGSVDLNKDGTPDVTISLVSVIHNLATFVVKLGAAPAVSAGVPEVPSTEPSEPATEPYAAEAPAPYEASAPADEAGMQAPVAAPAARKKIGPGTMLTVIVAVIVALLLVMHFRKKKQAF